MIDAQHLRLVEALLFAAPEPLDEDALRSRLPAGTDLGTVLATLAAHYEGRGIQLVRVAERWTFRTASDLADSLRLERPIKRRISRAALETLSVIAYHQPVTRADVEQIRGVTLSKGTLDVLVEAGWVRPGRRREAPGRPITWITTDAFLEYFSLGSLQDLPGVEEMRALGLFDFDPAGVLGEAVGPSGAPADRSAHA